MDYEQIDDYRGDIKDQLKIANGRTRSLENWRNYILGGMAIISLIVTWSVR